MILTGVDSLSTLSILKKKWKVSLVNNFKETLTRRKNLLNRGPWVTSMIKTIMYNFTPRTVDCWFPWTDESIFLGMHLHFCPVQGLCHNFNLASCEEFFLSQTYITLFSDSWHRTDHQQFTFPNEQYYKWC